MITELHIDNFKSLHKISLDNLQPVNLLIGPNNSGKSNILKALKFFGGFLVGNIPDEELLKILIFHEVPSKSSNQLEKLSIKIFTDQPDNFGIINILPPSKEHFIPSFAIVSGKSIGHDRDLINNTDNFISHLDSVELIFQKFESCYYNYPNLVPPATYFEEEGNGGPYNYGVRYSKFILNNAVKRRSVKGLNDPERGLLLPDSSQKQFFSPIVELKIYRPDPSKLLDLYPIQNEQTVNEDASNLVDFLITMSFRYKSIFQKITDDLQRFVPEFKDINFDVIKEPLKSIQEKYPNKSLAILGLTDIHERTFWADSLSEGTLYFLSLLCIIHQPEPPRLLLIEEPEKGIHPRRIRETMRLIFELAEEKNIQVILTTHSTAVVDTFADMPEAVYIVEREGQETKVKNLQRDVIEPHEEQFRAAGEEPIRFTDALGEHWAMGFLGGVPK